jgi:acyl-coenzyme A synthetase/AMP-(fatty) acid ligase
LTDPLEQRNLAEVICRRHADRVMREALLDRKPMADNCYTFGGLDFLSDKFASALVNQGVNEGDAVAAILEPSAAFAVAALGALKRGAVVVPVSPALDIINTEAVINDSGAKAMVAPFAEREVYAAIAARHSITTVFVACDSREAIHYEGAERSFWRDIFLASSDFTPAAMPDSAPAFIFYIKAAEGALRPITRTHAAILGQLAQINQSNEQVPDAEGALWPNENGTSPDVLLGLVFPTWWIGGAVRTEPKRG